MATFCGIMRGRRCTPPAPAMRPTRGSGRPDAGMIGGDDDVARQRHLEAAAERVAVDGGEDGLPAAWSGS